MSARRKQLVGMAFSKMDKNGSGFLDPEDVIDTYDASKHPDVLAGKKTTDEVLREFLDTFDVGGEKDGKVTRNEFENYYANVSSSIDDDDYFELMIRNAWHISGGEGWCANTSNRRVLVTHADGRQTVEEIRDDMGLKADDTNGMIARLRAQGINASNISLHDGMGQKKKATGPSPTYKSQFTIG
jgi:calcyphosin